MLTVIYSFRIMDNSTQTLLGDWSISDAITFYIYVFFGSMLSGAFVTFIFMIVSYYIVNHYERIVVINSFDRAWNFILLYEYYFNCVYALLIIYFTYDTALSGIFYISLILVIYSIIFHVLQFLKVIFGKLYDEKESREMAVRIEPTWRPGNPEYDRAIREAKYDFLCDKYAFIEIDYCRIEMSHVGGISIFDENFDDEIEFVGESDYIESIFRNIHKKSFVKTWRDYILGAANNEEHILSLYNGTAFVELVWILLEEVQCIHKKKKPFMAGVCTIYKLCTGMSLGGLVVSTSDQILLAFMKLYFDQGGLVGESGFVEVMQQVNDLSQDGLALLKCETGRKLLTLTSLMACVPIFNHYGITFENLGYDDAAAYFWQQQYFKKSTAELPLLMVEAVSHIILKAVEVSKFGPTALYTSGADYREFDTLYRWLKRNQHNFAICNISVNEKGEPDPFTLDDYAAKCYRALSVCDKIMPGMKSGDRDNYRILLHQREQITLFVSNVNALMKVNAKRKCPYALILCGDPGVGKTALKDILIRQMHMSDNRAGRYSQEYDPRYVYNRNADDEFYSGYTTAMDTIVLDDLAQKVPDIMKQEAGDDLKDLIRLVNNQPFVPNMASLEEKGKVSVLARYVLGTTNVNDLSAHFIYKCSSAVMRRFIFVEVEVKERFRANIGVSLKGNESDVNDLDLWRFRIYRFFPAGRSDGVMKYLSFDALLQERRVDWITSAESGGWGDIDALCRFVDIDMERHWRIQDRGDTALDNLDKLGVCDCGIAKAICKDKCKHTRSLQDIVYTGESDFVENFFKVFLCVSTELFLIVFTYLLGPPYLAVVLLASFLMNGFVKSLVYFIGYVIMAIMIVCLLVKEFLNPHERDDQSIFIRVALKIISYLPNQRELLFLRRILPDVIVSRLTVTYLHSLIVDRFTTVRNGEDYYNRFILKDYRYEILRIIAATAVAVGGYKLIYKIKRNYEDMIGQSSEAKMPEPDAHELSRRNYWLKENMIGTFPQAGSTISLVDLNEQVMLNTILIKAKVPGNTGFIRNNAFIICDNLFVTVAHWYLEHLQTYEKFEMVVVRQQKNGSYNEVEFIVDSSNMFLDVENDRLFIRSNKLLPGKNLLKYLASSKEPIKIKAKGVMHSLHPVEMIHTRKDLKMIEPSKSTSYPYKSLTMKADNCLRTVNTSLTGVGFCGSPIIAYQGNTSMICGIHCAGSKNGAHVGLARRLSKEDVDTAMSKMQLKFIPLDDAEDDIAFCAESKANLIVDVHSKCPTHDLHGEYHVLGGSSLPRARARTHVGKSIYQQDVLDYFKDKGYPALLHTSPIKCDPKIVIKNNVSKIIQNAKFAPRDVQFVVNCLTADYLRHFDDVRLAKLHPYPYEVAINGVDGIPYLERLNLKTSGGYGHPGPKRKMFELANATEEHAVHYIMTPELELECKYIEQQYLNGQEANPVFKCSFKDEPITFEKEARNKVRIFSGSPAAFSLVMRKYLLCLVREFVGHGRLDFEMAIGANAMGDDWELIYQHVIRHGRDRCFAGDYSSFDKQMPPELIMAAFEVMANILIKAGWDDDDIRIVRGIATDIAFPTTDLFGTLVQFYGSNPSGHVLTTIINSIVNSLYMRLAVVQILKENDIKLSLEGPTTEDHVNLSHFSDVMSLVTYGDDNCGSISVKFPFITHDSISKALASYNIVYTTDIKDAVSRDLVNVEEITFLKRRFVFSNEFERVIAPLDHDSLFKTLTIWTYSTSITVEEQAAAALEAVNAEYFFYGRDIFEERHQFLNTLVIKYSLELWLNEKRLLNYVELSNLFGYRISLPPGITDNFSGDSTKSTEQLVGESKSPSPLLIVENVFGARN